MRRDIWSLSPDDPIVIGYGNAVAAMQARPASDPTSWAYQAAIHGTAAAPPPLGDECRHGSWYFLPWHRMYLYFFERIVREAVIATGGPANWALPFWDYDRNGTRTLPEAFRNPTRPDGSPNPLYVAQRRPGINSGTLALPTTTTSAAFALSRPNFTGTQEFGGGQTSPAGQFQGSTGRVEQTPHNDVHVQIGGWMGNPNTAAQDPIFWLHHCNIDRLWAVWDDDTHANPIDAPWAAQQFFFFDENRMQAGFRCDGVGNTEKDLDYIYRSSGLFGLLRLPPEILELIRIRPPGPPWIRRLPVPIPPPIPGPPRDTPDPVGATDRPVRLSGDAARVRVPIDARAQRDAIGDAAPQRVVLTLDNIDAERNPETVYGIYVNLPDDPSPDEMRAHHAGNISLFGIERIRETGRDEHNHGSMRVSMDITDLVSHLAARGMWTGQDLDVTLAPIPLDVVAEAPEADALVQDLHHDDVPITVGRISVHME